MSRSKSEIGTVSDGTCRTGQREHVENIFKPLVGIGATYKLTERVDLRAEYGHVSNLGKSSTTGQMDDNMVSLGAVWHF